MRPCGLLESEVNHLKWAAVVFVVDDAFALEALAVYYSKYPVESLFRLLYLVRGVERESERERKRVNELNTKKCLAFIFPYHSFDCLPSSWPPSLMLRVRGVWPISFNKLIKRSIELWRNGPSGGDVLDVISLLLKASPLLLLVELFAVTNDAAAVAAAAVVVWVAVVVLLLLLLISVIGDVIASKRICSLL